MNLDKLFTELDLTLSKTKKVMVVDDNVAMTDYIAEFCLDEKIACYTFNNALDALQKFTLINPSILVVDWLMQPMDGFSFIKNIHKKHAKDIPILFMTGSAQADTQLKALQYKATSFIEKSNFNNDVLEAQIKALLNLSSYQDDHIKELTLSENPLVKQLNLTASNLHLLALFYDAINKYIEAKYSITHVIDYMQQTKSKLSSFISQAFGVSVQQFIISYRLYKAASLLLTGIQIQQVAEQLGYSSTGNFSNAFKKKYSKSPLNFVKTRQEHSVNHT